ncbi:N-acetylmuramoyl-L-alanine amidase family protein [Mucisphaera calidilacus]|uniref:N-acetylmuramoyl-L-alanine amidase n=1 Tax=Mucisphaera calidilacus TaxID=2527982 RepID=A0A518C189_9BACT|nr:N-acetylmuramoyl-L-alanine amidase [Mucisphaera calidilacus]QDU72993.1 N-acetylmuramoyl-L-alanine amidase AmiA [Mucisphaera calidilacus]
MPTNYPFRSLRAAFFGLVAVGLVFSLFACQPKPMPEPEPEPVVVEPPAFGEEGWEPAPLEEAMARLQDRDAWDPDGVYLPIPRHPAEKYLEGMVIVLDPGHGGKADVAGYKRGPTGVREAEMNLRVAFLLRELLEQAGCVVHLTREGETSEVANDAVKGTLKRRAEFANNIERPDGGVGADLFISIHHNASRPTANFTSIWYHGESDWAEVELDVARHIAFNTFRTMQTYQAGLTSPLLSDQLMYESGFGVMRYTKVPAVLLELSFFTHPREEQRLRDPHYNLKEAYGIYLGLVDYAYGGRPTQSLPVATVAESELKIETTLDDGMPGWWGSDRQRILSSTMRVTIDGVAVPHTYDPATKVLHATCAVPEAEADKPNVRTLMVHHANYHKHHNYPQRFRLDLTGEEPVVEPAGRPRHTNHAAGQSY